MTCRQVGHGVRTLAALVRGNMPRSSAWARNSCCHSASFCGYSAARSWAWLKSSSRLYNPTCHRRNWIPDWPADRPGQAVVFAGPSSPRGRSRGCRHLKNCVDGIQGVGTGENWHGAAIHRQLADPFTLCRHLDTGGGENRQGDVIDVGRTVPADRPSLIPGAR